MSQQFCLKWNNHMNNMMDVFKSLLSTESMVDVTLACDGLSLKAHKMVLSACSPFFQSLFLENPCKHPIVILKDMKYTELKAIIEFMYHGEVNVAQDQLSALMKTAETLRVKGLAEVTNEKNTQSSTSQNESSHRTVPRTDTPPPSSKRRRGRTRKRSRSDSNRSDDDSNEPKIKQPMSPDIEEISGDVTMDVSSSQFSNIQTPVPVQTSTPAISSNTYHKTSSVISQDPQIEEPTSGDEGDFGVEPTKLLEQTLTTEELNRRNRTNAENQRRSRSSADHTIVPTSMSSDTSNQQPDSPLDIKPEVLDLDPPMSPVAGPSHSNDNAMMMFMDQSNSSHPGPSGYQDNTALVPQDSQPQVITLQVISVEPDSKGAIKKNQVPVKKMNRLRSEIWFHFTIIDHEKAKCNYCKNILSVKGGNMGNLGRHMKVKHLTIPLNRGNRDQQDGADNELLPRMPDSAIEENIDVVTIESSLIAELQATDPEVEETEAATKSISLDDDVVYKLKTETKYPRKLPKYKCTVCCRMFEAKCHLTTHMRTHTGEKPYVCYLCGKRSARLYDLKTHISTHSGTRRHPCEFCSSSFNQKSDWLKHRKIHLQANSGPPKERKRIRRICEYCPESFTNKKDFLKHKVIHEGTKPFTCDVCEKGFMRKYDLKEHLRVHTGEKPYTCQICQANFRQLSNFRRHFRLCHDPDNEE